MGFRQGAVLFATCFFLGVQFVNFNTDYRLLFAPLEEQTFSDAFGYYSTFFNAPIGVRALLHSVIGVGIIGLLGKIHKWDESAMFFDGTSLALFMFGFIVYMSVVLPGLRTVVTPTETETEELRREAVRVLAAGNTLIVLCLVGVLALQGGQEWARRTEARLKAALEREESEKEAAAKKDQ
ncbi:Shr3 amino acid permease chaperone [Auricularia subglabra TFB-10046 SS5]|nr:Shr3 amino acid permease chaperone [Auricularia subglabra TFB-10046 SS5]